MKRNFPRQTCWDALSWNNGRGYIKVGDKQYAHRVAYELFVGPIPEGMVINHLCENPACVNPQHLEITDQFGNMRYAYRHITHCPSGHLYPDGRKRKCLTCHREREKKAKRWLNP